MIRRKRVLALVIGLTLVATSALGTRGLRLVVTNTTPAPLIDVKVAHPGGTIVVPRIEPGASAERTVHRPFAGLWGRSREVPLGVRFTQDGERSEPFDVRCELGWIGPRRVDLVADQSQDDRSVRLTAAMIGHQQVLFDRFFRNLLTPTSRPRGFYAYRHETTGMVVIRRHDWPREVSQQVELAASLVRAWRANPFEGGLMLAEYALSLRDRLTPKPSTPQLRLPFRDLRDAQSDTRANVIQAPLWP